MPAAMSYFDRVVETTPRLTAERLNTDGCVDLISFVMHDIIHDKNTALSMLRSNPSDIVAIIKAQEMLKLLESDYFIGITLGHGEVVAEEFENEMISILGYDPDMAFDIMTVIKAIIKREKIERVSPRTYKIVITQWDSARNDLKFIFPKDADIIANDPDRHIRIVKDPGTGHTFIVNGDFYDYAGDVNDNKERLKHYCNYSHFNLSRELSKRKKHAKISFRVSYKYISGGAKNEDNVQLDRSRLEASQEPLPNYGKQGLHGERADRGMEEKDPDLRALAYTFDRIRLDLERNQELGFGSLDEAQAREVCNNAERRQETA